LRRTGAQVEVLDVRSRPSAAPADVDGSAVCSRFHGRKNRVNHANHGWGQEQVRIPCGPVARLRRRGRRGRGGGARHG
jgi:hypothetical protein